MFKKWFEIWAVFLLMLALAVISTYPLVQYFDTGIPYAPFGGDKVWNRSGDQIQLMYWFWLVKENIIGNITPFHSNPFEFNMVLPHASSGMNTVPLAFIYMLFSPLGDITAYNCTILSSYVLTGVFMYLLVHLYSGSRTGALLAAVIFTFAPVRMTGIAAGHAYGLLFFCYPFILFFLEKGIKTKNILYGVLSGLGLIFLSMVEPHLIYYICVFLGVYIPVRIISLFPVIGKQEVSQGISSRAPLLSTAMVLGAGLAVTVYAQALFYYRDLGPFRSQEFAIAALVYPFLLLLISLFLSAVYQRISNLDFRESLYVEAVSLTPLYLSLPLLILLKNDIFPNGGLFVSAVIISVIMMKIWLLRKQILPMLSVIAKGALERWRVIVAVLPLVFSMGGIVYWMAASKVKQVAPTIAGGGRTLSDVSIFSAKVADLFASGSTVYIGIIPAVLGVVLLFVLLFATIQGNRRMRCVDESDFLRLFYFVVACFCLVLSLGLAFGNISLYALFYHYFPFFNYPRVSDRIITLSLFALAIVCGFVVKNILGRCKGRGSLAVAGSLVFAAMGLQLKDYNILKPMGINILDKGQDIYTYVKENIGDGRLLEVPFWPGDSHQSSLYQHYIMLDRIPRINGCSPMVLKEYIDDVFMPLSSINRGKLDEKQFQLLHQLGVKYVTVHNNRDVFLDKVSPFGPFTTIRRLANSPYLKLLAVDNSMHFKTWSKKNANLALFEVLDKEKVNKDSEQAWYDMPYFYDVYTPFYQQTGRIIEDKIIGGKVYQATEGEDHPGFIMYGPYITYPPGEYRSCFTLATDIEKGQRGVKLEVAHGTRKGEVAILASTEVDGGGGNTSYRDVCLDFSLSQKQTMEFRVLYNGEGEVRVEKVTANRVGINVPLYFLEAENMVGNTGNIVFSKDASGGKVIEGIVTKQKTGDLVYGPNRSYPKGKYKATFYVRINTKNHTLEKDEAIASVIVSDVRRKAVFAEKKVRVQDLNLDEQSFVGIETDFQLLHTQGLSFRMKSNGKVKFQLDKIEIEKQ